MTDDELDEIARVLRDEGEEMRLDAAWNLLDEVRRLRQRPPSDPQERQRLREIGKYLEVHHDANVTYLLALLADRDRWLEIMYHESLTEQWGRVLEERARVVAWLREMAGTPAPATSSYIAYNAALLDAANLIEAQGTLPPPPPVQVREELERLRAGIKEAMTQVIGSSEGAAWVRDFLRNLLGEGGRHDQADE